MEKTSANVSITNFDEPIGNLLQIFPELNLTREEIKKKIENTGAIRKVNPLEYFTNVGNGMNTESQKKEIEKIIPSNILDTKQRAKLALDYLENGNHIGVSQDQFERDLKYGKNHNETMEFFLERILADEEFEPCVVVSTKLANNKFGNGINKIILDGTHRAVIAALVNMNLDILEFSLDD